MIGRRHSFARHIVSVNNSLLQEHMQAPLVLGQGMTSNLIYERFQPLLPILNKILLEQAIVASK